MAELSLDIAGVRTAILTRDPEVAGVVHEHYKGFLSTGTADWRIEMNAAPAPSSAFDGDVVVKPDRERARFTVQRGDFAGTLDVARRSGTVALSEPDEVAIDSFLRIAYSLALLDVGGLLVHAASLIRHDRAYLFCGRSGSGKTTVARLSTQATLLSDELSLVRISDRDATCHGTPFRGALAQPGAHGTAPLAAIYFLYHGPRHAVEAVKPRQALERLLPNVLFFAREAELTARVLSIAGDLVETVPCFDLRFRPDPGFWEVIDRV